MIGTNKPDAVETVKLMLEDVKCAAASSTERDPASGAPGTAPANPQSPQLDRHGRPGDIISLLQEKGVAFVSFADWQILERIENERGALRDSRA